MCILVGHYPSHSMIANHYEAHQQFLQVIRPERLISIRKQSFRNIKELYPPKKEAPKIGSASYNRDKQAVTITISP